MLLFQDEKGPIAAKTYGGTSWCSTQAKIERAQKIKGILNVFGFYDHTNDRMITHCYKNKKSKQFVDFIERVELLYHDSNIKNIFIVLDNASIHRSKKVIDRLKSYHPRISLVFLPVRSPELNLIEVRWMWMQRQAINNSTFTKESDIGKAVNDWTDNYNQTHNKMTRNTLHNELIALFT